MTESVLSNAAKPIISFILVSYNQRRMIETSIRTIQTETTNIPHEIIVIDAGSIDGSRIWLGAQKDVLTFLSDHRLRSLGGQINIGCRAAQGEYIFFLGNGAFLSPGSLAAALDLVKTTADRAKPAAVTFQTKRKGMYGTFNLLSVNSPLAQNALLHRDSLEKIGWFKDDGWHNFLELDLTFRILTEGYKIITAPDSFIITQPRPFFMSYPNIQLVPRQQIETFRKRWEKAFDVGDIQWVKSPKMPPVGFSAPEHLIRLYNLLRSPSILNHYFAFKRLCEKN